MNHTGDEVGVHLMLITSCADDRLQVHRAGRSSRGVGRIGRSRFEAFDLGGGNVNIAAGGIGAHVEARGVANYFVMLMTNAEAIAQVGHFGGVKRQRED